MRIKYLLIYTLEIRREILISYDVKNCGNSRKKKKNNVFVLNSDCLLHVVIDI